MSPTDSPAADNPAADEPASLPAPSALLTAIPALLGFLPERSLILVDLGSGGRVGTIMRHDLDLYADGSPSGEMAAVIGTLGGILASGIHSGGSRSGGGQRSVVVAVICDDRFDATDIRYRPTLAMVDDRCADFGGLAHGFILPRFVAGTRWHRTWSHGVGGVGEHAGVLGDPRSCPTALARAVADGRRILHSRSEMRAMLTPTRHCDTGACDVGLAAWESLTDSSADQLAAIYDAVVGTPERFSCATVRELERAICNLRVRDAALALAVTDLRHPAEHLWRELTRRLTGTGRASAATLLAHLHYIGGEGSYAGIALDCALDADPDWHLAVLLDTALRNGVRPALLWEIIGDSYATAAALGIHLPRATLREAG
ncbi:MAG: DUF4192 domain-containing protein [Gordonia sp. (in: high G+C Gram-positive bacteria)]